MYKKYFGEDYSPEPYIHEEYKRARDHKYYMTSRLICVNDIYAFDPNAKVEPRPVRGHHRPQLPAAEGRPRLGQQPVRPHVAHHHVADAVPVGSRQIVTGDREARRQRDSPRFARAGRGLWLEGPDVRQPHVRSSTRSQLRKHSFSISGSP